MYSRNRAISHERGAWGEMARRGLCLLLSLWQSSVLHHWGRHLSGLFLLPLLCLSSSLLSSLPALLSTRGLRNALFTKDVSRGTWLSPLGVFRCLLVCGCVCVCHAELSSACTSSLLPVGIWVLGEECMIQDCFPWEQAHFPSYFVISGRARSRICHLQCGSVRSARKEEVRHNKHVQ